MITCPSCGANYRIDRASLGEGRRVRCQRCRTDWMATPSPGSDAGRPEAEALDIRSVEPIPALEEAAAIDAFDVAEDAPYQIEAAALPKSTVRKRPLLRGGGARRLTPFRIRPVAMLATASIVICGVLIGARAAVIETVPSLASFYAAIGLPVNIRGLSIADVRSVEHIEEGVPLLMVTGAVENLTSHVVEVPRIRLAVTGGGERELYAWTTVAARAKLEPGQSTMFRARLASPPAEGSGVAVRFLARRDLVATAGH